jgi:hypothetical protein
MSDISATADYSAAVDAAPVSEGLGETYESPSTPSETFDAPVGETTESAAPVEALFEHDGTPITLDEARSGYLRQSDYTKKTQELSEMRTRLAEAEAIAEALRADPVATLNALSQAFDVGLQAQAPPDPFADMDPEEARIAVLEQKIAAQEQAALQSAIDAEIAGLHQQHGDFNDQELFAHAIKGGFPSLRAAFADMNFNQLQSQLAELQRKQSEEAARVAAKRDAAVIHDGGARVGGTVTNASPESYGSIRDAFLAAKKALGV